MGAPVVHRVPPPLAPVVGPTLACGGEAGDGGGDARSVPFEIVFGANRLGHNNMNAVMVGGLGEADMTALKQAMSAGFAKLEKAHKTDPNAAAVTAPEPESTLRTGGAGTYAGRPTTALRSRLKCPLAPMRRWPAKSPPTSERRRRQAFDSAAEGGVLVGEVLVVRQVVRSVPLEDRQHEPRSAGRPADPGAGLDVLRHVLGLPGDDHQAEAFHIDPDLQHRVGGQVVDWPEVTAHCQVPALMEAWNCR